jgi:hypothetical protein
MSDRKKQRMKKKRPASRRDNNSFNPRGFSAAQTYRFRLVVTGTLSSDSKGVVAGVIPFDPSSGHLNVPEFNSDLANLYTQYRLWGTRIRLFSAISTSLIQSISVNQQPIALGFQWRSTATLATPAAYATVLDNQPSLLWPVANDTSSRGVILKQRVPNMLTFLETNAATSPGNAGAPGGFQFFGNGFTATIQVATYCLEVFYELRSRS